MKQATTHTPGPWKADKNGLILAKQDGQRVLVSMPPGANPLNAHDNVAWPGCGAFRANARLIAAVPDLLEAVRAVLDSAECTIGDGGSVIGEDYRLMLVEALAKAVEA